MKKFYVFAASAIVAAGMCAQANVASSLWIVGDPVGGWNPVNGQAVEMKEAGVFEGTLNLEKNSWFAFVDQLGADANDWTGFNAHRYGPSENNIVPEDGKAVSMVYGQDRSFQLPTGEYTYTVNTNDMTFTIHGKVEVVMGDLYVRGLNGNWDATDDMKLTKTGDDEYSITLASISAGSTFKIANADWSFSYTTDNKKMELGQTYDLMNQTGDNMGFASAVDDVTLTVNTATMKLTTAGKKGETVAPENLFIIGNINGKNWDTAEPLKMTKTGNLFTASGVSIINSEAEDGDNYAYFTFITAAGADWDIVNASPRVGAPEHDCPITADQTTSFMMLTENMASANSWKVEAGNYNVEVDFDNITVRLLPSSQVGVTEAVVDFNAPAEYYNLQGIRVANPDNGLYIVRQNGKTVKVLLNK